jgi:hypothetical protein
MEHVHRGLCDVRNHPGVPFPFAEAAVASRSLMGLEMPRIDELISVVNHQKVEVLALRALAVALLRAMPLDMQSRALSEFNTETDTARTVLLYSKVPDEVPAGFDRAVEAVNGLRRDRLQPPDRT